MPIPVPATYDWKIAAWKVVRGALMGAVSILLASGGVDVFFNTLSTGIGTLGMPVWMIPVITGAIVFIRNYIKQWLASRVPPVTPDSIQ
jgi:TRAP-type C4-dicarboxylate transport system permease small subunit